MNNALKQAKSQATKLSTRLKQLGVDIKRTQSLEAIAAINNYPDWNRFSAAIESGAVTSLAAVTALTEHPRYVVGGFNRLFYSHYPRKLFLNLIESGMSPVYVELRDPSILPFNHELGADASQTGISFDMDGHVQCVTEGDFKMALTCGRPMHISVFYDPSAEDVSLPNEVVKRKRRAGFSQALMLVNELLADYCKSAIKPVIIIDDARDISSAALNLSQLWMGKDGVELTDGLMSLAPSVLFAHNEDSARALCHELALKYHSINSISPKESDDEAFMSSIRSVFPKMFSVDETGDAAKKIKEYEHLYMACNLSNFDFLNKAELTEYLVSSDDWKADFVALVDSNSRLVETCKSFWREKLGNASKRPDELSRGFSELSLKLSLFLYGEEVNSAIAKLATRAI